MRFADEASAVEAVRKAVELGVNYVDVAPLYGGGTAEPYLGHALKGIRDKVIVTAKSSTGNGWDQVGEFDPIKGFGVTTADHVRFMIDRSMKLLQVDHLDVYHLWAVHAEVMFDEALKPNGFLDGVVKAKAEGLCDHIGLTSHLGADALIRCMEKFDFDMLTIPFHLLDTSRAKAIEYCAERGIAVIAMNPLAGGTLTKPSPVLGKIAADLGLPSMTEAALRFLIGYPGLTTALAGITCADQAVMDVKAAEKGGLDRDTAESLMSQVSELFSSIEHLCTTCGYCGTCPEGISIPQVLSIYTGLLVPSMADASRELLAENLAGNPDGYNPARCVACKVCEGRCPNELPISELMAKAAARWAD